MLDKIGSILTWAGILILLHSGYSAHHYKRISPDFTVPPADVLLEVCAAFGLMLIGKLLPIKIFPVRYSKKTNVRKFEESYERPDFVPVNHRGALLRSRGRQG